MEGFLCGTKIHCGTDALGQLSQFSVGRLLVVTDPYFYKNGTAQQLADMAQPTACEFFHQVTPDPSVTLVSQGTALVQAFGPDTVLALGGGSAMDCAKAMVYFSGMDIRLIAVPTTSGSGSEVTDFAILTHNGVKHPLVDRKLRPHHAIIDSRMVTNLPRTLIAEGGFDLITHALEAYTGKNATAYTDALAIHALRTALEDLERSYHGDLAARERVHNAATMAALAFTNAGLGVCHALSHSLGGQLHLPHGRLNAILLPAVIAESNHPKYISLAQHSGIEGSCTTIARRNLQSTLCRLRKNLNLPTTLSEAGIPPHRIRDHEAAILDAAMADPCCKTESHPVTRQFLQRILARVIGP